MITNLNANYPTFRAPKRVQIKARLAGNGRVLAKRRNAELIPLWRSLWARLCASTNCVVGTCCRVATAACRRLVVHAHSRAECRVISVRVSKYPSIVLSPGQQKGSLLSSMLLLILFAGSILVFADYLLQPDRFPISRISFIGEFRHVERAALQENVAPYIGNNFFAIDLQKLEAALRDIDWVSDVSVSRRWPDTLQVSVKEQRLIAAWNKTGWVTSDATVVEIPGIKMPGLPRWSGPEGTQVLVQHRFQQFSRLLADVGIQLRKLSYSQRGAWQISASNHLRNEQISIRLGRRDMQDRLYRFARAYGQTLGKLEQRLISVDLRYPNGFAVKWNSIEETEPVKAG